MAKRNYEAARFLDEALATIQIKSMVEFINSTTLRPQWEREAARQISLGMRDPIRLASMIVMLAAGM